jgi:hypothetical protein
MIVIPIDEWEALQAELQELRKITQNTSSPLSPEQEEWFNAYATTDPQEPYGKTDWKAIVDSGKWICNDEGHEIWLSTPLVGYYRYWDTVVSPITFADWQSVERKMQQSKGWKVKP